MAAIARQYWKEGVFVLAALVAFGIQASDFLKGYETVYGAYNLQVDSDKYYNWATEIASGARKDIPKDQPPGFILYLAGLFSVFGDSLLLPKVVNLALVALTAICVGLSGALLFGRVTALFAFLLCLFSPALLAYSATIQYEVFSAFLLSLSILLCFLIRAEYQHHKKLLLLGLAITFGVLTLSREIFLFCFPVILLWLFQQSKLNRTDALVLIGSYSLIVGTWIAYQSMNYGEFIPISKKASFNLEIGNNPNANGTYNLVMQLMEDPKGLEFIKQEPLHALKLLGRKVAYFFGFLKDGWNVPRYGSVVLHKLSLGILPYEFSLFAARSILSLIALLGAGLVLFRPSNRKAWFLAALLLPALAIHGLMISSYRFSIPFASCLFLLAALSLSEFFRLIRSQPSIKQGTALSLLAVAYLLTALYLNPKPKAMEFSARSLDSFDARDVEVLSSGQNIAARYLPKTEVRRPALLMTDEYFPEGEFELSVRLRAGKVKKNTLSLAALDEFGKPFCSKRLKHQQNDDLFRDISLRCKLEKKKPIRFVLFTNSESELWLKSLRVNYL